MKSVGDRPESHDRKMPSQRYNCHQIVTNCLHVSHLQSVSKFDFYDVIAPVHRVASRGPRRVLDISIFVSSRLHAAVKVVAVRTKAQGSAPGGAGGA